MKWNEINFSEKYETWNGKLWNGMEWIINVNLFVGYAKITISTLHLLFKWYYSVI